MLVYRRRRYNQELEEDSVVLQQERLQLQQQAANLAQRLEAVLFDKFIPRAAFDADTPIDKTLAFLQDIIMVGLLGAASFVFCPWRFLPVPSNKI